jgi:ABC-type sugar transport system substrate-binding protein
MVAASLAVTGLVLAGCAGTTDPGDDTEAPSGDFDSAAIQERVDSYYAAPTEILQTEPVDTPPTDISVIFLTNGQGGTTRIMQGVEAGAAAVGWDFESIAFDVANPATLNQAYLTALSKGADFVVQSGTPQANIPDTTLDAYRDAGAKIILTSVAPIEPNDVVLGDPNGPEMQKTSGEMLADWFMLDSEGSGKVLIESVSAFPVLLEAVEGFRARVAEDCADCSTQVLEIAADQIASGGIVPSVVNALRADPDINYVMFDNLQFANGIQSALSAAGLDVKVFGRSVDPNAAAGLADGTIAAGTGTSFFYTGQDVSTSLNDNQPTQLITKENLDSIDSEGLWNLPTDALAQYAELWGVTPPPCTLGCYED